MKLDLKTWALIIVSAAFVLYIIFDRDPEPKQEEVMTLKTEIKTLGAEKQELKVKHDRETAAFVQKIAELRDSLVNEKRHGVKLSINLKHLKAKPEIIKIVTEFPIIDTVFQYYDSLLIGKDQELAIQDAIIKSQEVENKRITDNFNARLRLTEQEFEAQKELTEIYRKEGRKERRKVKLWKVATVLGTVGGILLGAQ